MEEDNSKNRRRNFLVGVISAVLCATITFLVGRLTSPRTKTEQDVKESSTSQSSIELSETQIPAVLETQEGEIEIVALPTVESVDSANVSALSKCLENEEECGLGAFFYAPTDTPFSFKDYTLGKCWDTDGYYGEQCWDLGDLFWQNYAGRRLSTCGTGAAKGAWEGDCKYVNAGEEFELITDPNAIQPGDWVIFNNGTWGHVGMALGTPNDGYIALLGQNQGGALCPGSEAGGTTNIVNISLNSFAGAFRPKTYILPEPEPEPEPEEAPEVVPISGCIKWHVERGDTMSRIMLECENTVVYGSAMDAYAQSWYSLLFVPGQSVYDGWHSESGVGLYADDEIEHRTE